MEKLFEFSISLLLVLALLATIFIGIPTADLPRKAIPVEGIGTFYVLERHVQEFMTVDIKDKDKLKRQVISDGFWLALPALVSIIFLLYLLLIRLKIMNA